MRNKEGDYVRSLWFMKGRPAEISAGFDRAVTNAGVFIDKQLGADRQSLINIQLPSDNFRYEIHRRSTGMDVEKQWPDGSVHRMNRADIVHVYSRGADNQEQLIERKRVKDNPQGFSNASRR